MEVKLHHSNLNLLEGVPVVLIRIRLVNDVPQMGPPIRKGKSDQNGEVSFEDIEKEDNVIYRIGLLFEGERIASKIFAFKKVSSQIIDIDLPETVQGLDDLEIVKHTFLILPIYKEGFLSEQDDSNETKDNESLQHGILIQEVINFVNPTKNQLDGTNYPLSKPIQKDIHSFLDLTNVNQFKLTLSDGWINFHMKTPKGSQQLSFYYDFPTDPGKSNKTIVLSVLKRTQEVEILTLEGGLAISIPGQMVMERKVVLDNISGQWITRESFDPKSKAFMSYTFQLANNTENFNVIISRIPISKIYLWILSIFFILILVLGLLYFREKKLSAIPEED